MSTRKSNALKSIVLNKLEAQFGRYEKAGGTYAIYRFGKARINLRVTTKKSGEKFWFDITPALYERSMVDFFVYACGGDDNIYIFQRKDMQEMVSNASRGGINNVPNFTIYTDCHEFEPAGHADQRISIRHFHNAFGLIENPKATK